MQSACSSSCTLTRRSPKVRHCVLSHIDDDTCELDLSEFSGKREKAVSTNERLQLEAQAVLDVIENPDVAQALRQDKNQNLQYLKDNYNVRARLPSTVLQPIYVQHSSLSNKSLLYTTLGSSNIPTATTAVLQTICITSVYFQPITISTLLRTGVNLLPTSSPENGRQLSKN